MELCQSNHGKAGNHEAGGFVNSAVNHVATDNEMVKVAHYSASVVLLMVQNSL